MDMFEALAEPTRRDIIEIVANNGEMPASGIYEKFHVSHPAISQHLKILREANLLNVEKRAQQRIYRLNPKTMSQMEKWARRMMQTWDERFDALDNVLREEKGKIAAKNKMGNKHGRK